MYERRCWRGRGSIGLILITLAGFRLVGAFGDEAKDGIQFSLRLSPAIPADAAAFQLTVRNEGQYAVTVDSSGFPWSDFGPANFVLAKDGKTVPANIVVPIMPSEPAGVRLGAGQSAVGTFKFVGLEPGTYAFVGLMFCRVRGSGKESHNIPLPLNFTTFEIPEPAGSMPVLPENPIR
jgi:hypothetical protein